MLELSRNAWLAEVDAFADRRRLEKPKHRRSPLASEVRYLHGWRWPGPEGHRVMLREVGILWDRHATDPCPDVPTSVRHDLLELNATLAGCVSTYLRNDGTLGSGHKATLLGCLRKLRRHLHHPGYLSSVQDAFGYYSRLFNVAELVLNDAYPFSAKT
ncbi:hypothetical protein ABT158_20875 [Nonomuraea sp. NPDC001636]|uniref:hypothetical protein n=1 Tax=Nonomuraea sp. NPDC001636 TaxID=3154391 RepID=UPI0033316653